METLTLDEGQTKIVIDALGQCSFFRGLSPESLSVIVKYGEAQRFDPDDVIIRQGDSSDSFFVIVDGTVSVRLEKSGGDFVELGKMPPKSSIGEVGVLLDESRTATVVANDSVLALKFPAKALRTMFQKIPDFGMGICKGLAYRLQALSGRRISLPAYDTSKGAPGPEILKMLPLDLCIRHRVLAIETVDNLLTMGMVDEPATQVLSAVHELLPGMETRPVQIPVEFFNEVLKRYGGISGWSAPAAEAPPVEVVKAESRSPRLDAMLERIVAEGASDLHLASGHRPHWRIDGDIQAIPDVPVLGSNETRELLEPVMEKRHIDEFEAHLDTDFAYALGERARFRVNMYKDRHGIGAALRLIPSQIMTMEQLGLPPVIKTLCEIPKGLILVTGPTGSGKSTTLAAMIDHIIKTKKAHIVTLEDPIEFVHRSDACLINQRELGGHVSSFARGLRAALREDPDIVLVGEMRDPETVALALETANTGHLVLATLHTNTAITALERVIDQFPGDQRAFVRTTLADVLRGVVAQTLCKKIGGGRMAVIEVMVINLAVANLVREGKTVQIPSIMQTSRGIGMTLLNDELARNIEAKKIDMQEALSKAIDKEDLIRRFRSGITIAEEPPAFERFRVVSVKPGTPSMEAGFRHGDMIVEVDGRAAKDLTLEDARIAFRTEMLHEVVVDRGGKKLKISFDLRK